MRDLARLLYSLLLLFSRQGVRSLDRPDGKLMGAARSLLHSCQAETEML